MRYARSNLAGRIPRSNGSNDPNPRPYAVNGRSTVSLATFRRSSSVNHGHGAIHRCATSILILIPGVTRLDVIPTRYRLGWKCVCFGGGGGGADDGVVVMWVAAKANVRIFATEI